MFCDIWVPNEAEVLESNVLRRLTHPDDIEAEMDPRVSLMAITRDKRDSPSRSRLEPRQGSHVDGIQRFNRYIFLKIG
jgi:hypothetical protein